MFSLSHMQPDTILIAISTVVGPVSSVALALRRQGRFEEKQRKFQRELTTEIEAQRTVLTKEMEAQRTKFDQQWNRAELNRYDELNNGLYHICKAINPDYGYPDRRR